MLVNLVSFSIQMAKTFATVPNCLRLSQSYLSLYPPPYFVKFFLFPLFAQQNQNVFYKTSVKKNAVSQFAPFQNPTALAGRQKFLWQKKIAAEFSAAIFYFFQLIYLWIQKTHYSDCSANLSGLLSPKLNATPK